MGKILNFGSVNIDHVYAVPHFVRPGETIASAKYSIFSGGKGFNQSTALARAGADICHAGKIGADGVWLRDALKADGADVSRLLVCDSPTGHAIIQVDATGQNCIIIEGGANRAITANDAASVLEGLGEGDVLLIQNEISALPEIMRLAASRGMKIVFNPAPMAPEVKGYPLDLVSVFIVNEVEAGELSGVDLAERGQDAVLAAMKKKFPHAGIVLTLGSQGSVAVFGDEKIFVPSRKVAAVDTTAAGDTYIGYLLAGLQRGCGLKTAMEEATVASAICVTRSGAAPSIPVCSELIDFCENKN